MYATDASPYEVLPLCVVCPLDKEDVIATVEVAHRTAVPITARGGGSGLVGAALGRGIVLDFSRHMNRVLSIERDSVTCEPGIYKRNLDLLVSAAVGRIMPADPSPEPYCTIGGMIGTNASGAHSLKYGHTVDYLQEADVVLYDGTLVTLGPIDLRSYDWKSVRDSGDSKPVTRLYNRLFDLVEPSLDTIRAGMPKVSKNSAGYRLDKVLSADENQVFNPAKVLCGAEGTLGLVVRAKFRTIKKPAKKGLLILRYDSFEEMGDAIPSITELGPAAAELMDRRVIESASGLNPEVKELNKGRLIALIVEFDGDDEGEIERKIRSLQQKIAEKNSNESTVVTDAGTIERIWQLREESLGFAYKIREGKRRTECIIEDTVVPPRQLGRYLERLYGIYKELSLDSMSWGHVSEGNIHTRPFLNYKDHRDLVKAKTLADRIYALVWSFNGSSTGEHSDGILRAPYLGTIYSAEMVELFRETKGIFDPANLLNPEKKTGSLGMSPLRDLRYGETYRRRDQGRPPAEVGQGQRSEYRLNWGAHNNKVTQIITGRETELGFEDEVESCFGCGKCRELSNTSRMCPVFDAEEREVSACRGRNNLLRWMNKLEGTVTDFATTREYGEVIYKNCIQCKMCMVDCPANTNVGKLMAEARARYADSRGLPRGYKFFFEIDRYGRAGCRLAPISNKVMKSGTLRTVIEYATGLDRHKSFPPFHRRRFVDRFRRWREDSAASKAGGSRAGSEPGGLSQVVFFYDTYINYNDPELGMRIVRLLQERNDIEVIVPEQLSSGLPAILEGDPARGRRNAIYNVNSLAPFAERGIPIVTFSPSAGLALKSDYLDVYDTPESRIVSENTYDIHEFVVELDKQRRLRKDNLRPIDRECLVHLHCHTIVQQVADDVSRALHLIPSLKFNVLNNGCCGNGGSYSFIKGNLERSFRMGRGLTDDIKNSKLPVYSTGESCKVQLEQSTGGIHVGLTSELLAEASSV